MDVPDEPITQWQISTTNQSLASFILCSNIFPVLKLQITVILWRLNFTICQSFNFFKYNNFVYINFKSLGRIISFDEYGQLVNIGGFFSKSSYN